MTIRKSTVSGLFYEATPDGLSKTVDAALLKAKKEVTPSDKTFGAISPHAGYIFSGNVSALALESL
ncbi:hypothetical protein MsAm2_12640 [Methanolapillus ohkumae]|uniref:AmmeMemoRadiSam system protein B n=1 Tax=Methanolapillus ohkumae TaxID=3028298 RepID=A0AA96VJB4_9EURY|nr:hypothetical protein MsAm2_12640 [Methanosarcinaceae archaeon Am2]